MHSMETTRPMGTSTMLVFNMDSMAPGLGENWLVRGGGGGHSSPFPGTPPPFWAPDGLMVTPNGLTVTGEVGGGPEVPQHIWLKMIPRCADHFEVCIMGNLKKKFKAASQRNW